MILHVAAPTHITDQVIFPERHTPYQQRALDDTQLFGKGLSLILLMP